LAKLITIVPEKPFQKCGLDFIGLVKPILVTINYATKWVEAHTFHTNIATINAKFLYEHVFLLEILDVH
jgi:hypothetical protein